MAKKVFCVFILFFLTWCVKECLGGWMEFPGSSSQPPGSRTVATQRITRYVCPDRYFVVVSKDAYPGPDDFVVWEKVFRLFGWEKTIQIIVVAFKQIQQQPGIVQPAATNLAPAARPAGKLAASWGKIKGAR